MDFALESIASIVLRSIMPDRTPGDGPMGWLHLASRVTDPDDRTEEACP
jgi:hypothetical protein